MGREEKTPKARRGPALLRLSPEMQRLCALLIDEVSEWPQVRSKPMFGFISFYRGGTIFAAVPKTRALHSANSIIFKLPPGSRLREMIASDPQVLSEFTSGIFANWFPLELADESSLRGAMTWLERAYEAAAPNLRKKSGPGKGLKRRRA